MKRASPLICLLHNLILAHSLAMVEKACLLPSSNNSSNPTQQIGYLLLRNKLPPKLVSSRTNNHLLRLIILWVNWAQLGDSSALGGVGSGYSPAEIQMGWSIKMVDPHGWELVLEVS